MVACAPSRVVTQDASVDLPNAGDPFWSIIERTRGPGGQDAQAERLLRILWEFPPAEVRTFAKEYQENSQRAYDWDLWAAAYLINGGCSDDCFAYFRDWLIGQGEVTFEGALRNPETLVAVLERGGITPFVGETEFEDLGYIAPIVYEKKTGIFLDIFEFELDWKDEPSGRPFDEGALEERLPKLAAWVQANG